MEDNSPLMRRISGGLLAFGICSAYGLRLLYLGITNQILDQSGMEKAPRWMYLAGGALMQLPLAGYVSYLFHQGYFAR